VTLDDLTPEMLVAELGALGERISRLETTLQPAPVRAVEKKAHPCSCARCRRARDKEKRR
jgi:hypothetical protein